jgi:hypothetical protein
MLGFRISGAEPSSSFIRKTVTVGLLKLRDDPSLLFFELLNLKFIFKNYRMISFMNCTLHHVK